MAAIPTPNGRAEKKLFHNQLINVYPTQLALEDITFWRQNNRTIFTFERLCRLKGKKLEEISIQDITQFVAEQDVHRLQELTDSIERNGVQVPLIIRDDGILLDGNRRYFACQWLKMQCAERNKIPPQSLSEIPVLVIRQADLKAESTLELKILAEANFIRDLKVPWPLDAQARAVEDYYQKLRKGKKDHEEALAEIVGVFGITRQRAIDLLETLNLTKQFIKEGGKIDEKIRRRGIVEDKFVYFWEFRNKAMKGRGAFDEYTGLEEVREMFFRLMAKEPTNPITNVKQVEPLAQAKRHPTAWKILKESDGEKLSVVVSIMNENKEIRMAEDKIRIFLSWLNETKELTPAAKALLREVARVAESKSKSKSA
jgi:ParB-like chromosome segregation protein Spo0J